MRTRLFGAAVVMTLAVASVFADRHVQNDAVQAGRLSSRIGLANPDRYKSIREANHWENPYLVIRRDGIEVIAKSLPSGRTTVPSVDLPRTLIALPVTAWPYGRVAAVQEISIRAGDRSDDKPIAGNLDAALAILKKLDVTVDRWPG
jgi:hypothetical protein